MSMTVIILEEKNEYFLETHHIIPCLTFSGLLIVHGDADTKWPDIFQLG